MISISTVLTILFIFLFLVGIGLHALIAPDLHNYKKMKRDRSNIKLLYDDKTFSFIGDDEEGIQGLKDAGFIVTKTNKDGE